MSGRTTEPVLQRVKSSDEPSAPSGSKIAEPSLSASHLLGSLRRAALGALRASVRWCFETVLAFMVRHRNWLPALIGILGYFPPLEARLRRFAKARYLPGLSPWMIEPEPAALSAWTALLSQRR